ncbi:sensor histidine kinase [Spirochaeta cellobiosiphila]|uniref:sensor histidine kinase n=1 Tax=Spirochaeta cellobiosiphila TaxID=504483 RepID=UPI0003F8396D|nr:sensor histidine kinase [Spirochaeta cellobiosiphila]
MNIFIKWFLDIPIGRKLVLVYFGGFFLPLILVVSYFTYELIQAGQVQEDSYLKESLKAVTDDLENYIDSFSLISKAIVADSVIYRLLLDEYPQKQKYQEVHSSYLWPELNKYIAGYNGIEKILFYVSNPSIGVSSGYVTLNEDNLNSTWYKLIKKTPSRQLLLMHKEEDRRLSLHQGPYLSLYKYISNPSYPSKYEVILRMDMSVSILKSILSSSPLKGNLQLRDGSGHILTQWLSIERLSRQDRLLEVKPELDLGYDLRISGMVASMNPTVGDRFSFLKYVLVLILSLGLASIFVYLVNLSITSRLKLLSKHMKKVEKEDFSPITIGAFGHDEIATLLNDFNLMAQHINYLINKVYRQDIERNKLELTKKQAELDNLQSQINPHFLNNVLESIRMKSVIKDEYETADVILKLSRLFRRMVEWDHDLIPLESELAFTSEYLDIQKYRFEDRLKYEIYTDYRPDYWLIPRITIQGIVENACMHGLENVLQQGSLIIRVFEENDFLIIEVKDNGEGFDLTHVPDGIGLSNLKKRLDLYYQKDHLLHIHSSIETGTYVRIQIPYREDFFES